MTDEILLDLENISEKIKSFQDTEEKDKTHKACVILSNISSIQKEIYSPWLKAFHDRLYKHVLNNDLSFINETTADIFDGFIENERIAFEKSKEIVPQPTDDFKKELEEQVDAMLTKYDWYYKEGNTVFLGFTKDEIEKMQNERHLPGTIYIADSISYATSKEAQDLGLKIFSIEPDIDLEDAVNDAIYFEKFGCSKEEYDNNYRFEEDDFEL